VRPPEFEFQISMTRKFMVCSPAGFQPSLSLLCKTPYHAGGGTQVLLNVHYCNFEGRIFTF
jgi:hypothetical protein